MKKKYGKYFQRYMVRPIIYKAFARLLYALTIGLLWNRFVNEGGFLSLRVNFFALLCLFFALFGWMNYLQLDGVSIPNFARIKEAVESKKKPRRMQGDIADYTDEAIISYDDLEVDERTFCNLVANLFLFLVFGVLSLL